MDSSSFPSFSHFAACRAQNLHGDARRLLKTRTFTLNDVLNEEYKLKERYKQDTHYCRLTFKKVACCLKFIRILLILLLFCTKSSLTGVVQQVFSALWTQSAEVGLCGTSASQLVIEMSTLPE